MFPNEWSNIIALILLLSLLIAFPIIGAKAGWKKAAYWGGGNLLFYIIGTLIYRFAGEAMAKALAPKMLELFINSWHFKGATVEMITPIIRSWLGPVVFIAIFLLGNLILVINYYTWFKKVAGVSRTDYAKKIVKMSKKFGETPKLDKNDPKVIKYKVTNEDLVQVQSKKYKGLNGVVGCFGLLALMAPSTIALSQAAIYTTTSEATREDTTYDESLRGIGAVSYGILNGIATKATWFSFYGDQKVGDDFNSLMSLLRIGTNLSRKFLDNGEYKWINPSSGEKEAFNKTWTNSLTVYFNCYGQIYSNLCNAIITLNSIPEEAPQEITESARKLETAANNAAKAWNYMVNALSYDIQGFFASENLLNIIPLLNTTKAQMTSDYINKLMANEVLTSLQQALSNTGTITVRGVDITISTAMNRITLDSNKHLEPMINFAMQSYDTSALSEDDKLKLIASTEIFNYMFYWFN